MKGPFLSQKVTLLSIVQGFHLLHPLYGSFAHLDSSCRTTTSPPFYSRIGTRAQNGSCKQRIPIARGRGPLCSRDGGQWYVKQWKSCPDCHNAPHPPHPMLTLDICPRQLSFQCPLRSTLWIRSLAPRNPCPCHRVHARACRPVQAVHRRQPWRWSPSKPQEKERWSF